MTDVLKFRRSSGEPLSSSELLRECGERLTDPDLWKEFQNRFHKTIITLVMRVLCNRFRSDCVEQACDLVQEVYLRLIANNARLLRSYKGDTDFSARAFMAGVTVNVVSDHHRSTQADKRRPAEIISIEEARDQGVGLDGEAVEMDIASILSWIDVERLVEFDDDRRNAARNVLIFKLHYVDQLPVADIAKFPVFGLKESAVHLVLQKMRAHLKKRMGR